MKKFNAILEELPDISHIEKIKLLNNNNDQFEYILNKPGAQGSVKLYNHLFLVFGELNMNAAMAGLDLYCEHVEDAKNNPGKHPNIDRLIDITSSKETLRIEIIQN